MVPIGRGWVEFRDENGLDMNRMMLYPHLYPFKYFRPYPYPNPFYFNSSIHIHIKWIKRVNEFPLDIQNMLKKINMK